MSRASTLVVVSHYDRRPLKDLVNILDTIGNHEAGVEFRVCVVVNQECGKPVDLGASRFPVTVLFRPNVGMNIGAWDYGWRQNPGYEHYVFLQDECLVRRDGWLACLIKTLREPNVGMVGECLNHRWSKPWPELISQEVGSADQNSNSTAVAKRARLCLDLLQKRGIPAGKTARHLRSLVWALSRESLERLDGFPLGQDYDECIAAEIFVSRHVESLDLAIRQVHSSPFYYIAHAQWINTYPGFCASLNYTNWAQKHFANPQFPFLPAQAKGDVDLPAIRLARRVETERGLFDSGVLSAPRRGFVALLVVVIDKAPLERDWGATVSSWCLQSAPYVDIVFAATDNFLLKKTKAWINAAGHEEFSQIRTVLLSDWTRQNLDAYEFVVFARPGDALHPSLASVLAVLNTKQEPDILVWNERRSSRSSSEVWLVRQPQLETLTIQTIGHIGMAFAVRSGWIKEFPFDFSDDLLNNNLYLFHLWLSRQANARWMTYPEVLAWRLFEDNAETSVSKPHFDALRGSYREITHGDSELELATSRNGRAGCPLSPISRARSISVIVSFRDRAPETIACLRSLVDQKSLGHLEIILINNLSCDEQYAEVKSAVDLWRQEGCDIKLVDYNLPFNHSRQTNLGVKLSSGEVLVFLNNDTELLGAGILEEMSAWALVSEVGTVSCQIVDHKAQLICAGIRAREEWPAIHASPVEESRERTFRNQVREVLANTFACAAISRLKFETVGLLNEAEFPNGYNDVEYCMRSRRQGYRHVYLGHLRVKHTPGTSRGRCDETFQKIVLRLRYPEIGREGMVQLSGQLQPVPPPGGKATSALEQQASSQQVYPSDEAPIGLKKALRILYKAIIFWVQRRILNG